MPDHYEKKDRSLVVRPLKKETFFCGFPEKCQLLKLREGV